LLFSFLLVRIKRRKYGKWSTELIANFIWGLQTMFYEMSMCAANTGIDLTMTVIRRLDAVLNPPNRRYWK